MMMNSYYSILKQPWNTMFSLVLLKLIQTPAAVALILCIVGATNASDPSQIESESTVHIGIILYTVVYVALFVLAIGSMLGRRMTGRGEVPLIIAVLCTLPFLAVRLLYALLAAFSHDNKFNPASGSTTVALFMDTLPEMIVVVIYLVVALKTPAVPRAKDGESHTAGETLMYRAGRGDFGFGKLGLLSLAAAAGQAFRSDRQDGRRKNEYRGRPERQFPGQHQQSMPHSDDQQGYVV